MYGSKRPIILGREAPVRLSRRSKSDSCIPCHGQRCVPYGSTTRREVFSSETVLLLLDYLVTLLVDALGS